MLIQIDDALFKERLSLALKYKGIKQKELAQKIGVLPMTVNRWLKFVFKLRTKTLSLFHELVKEIKKC